MRDEENEIYFSFLILWFVLSLCFICGLISVQGVPLSSALLQVVVSPLFCSLDVLLLRCFFYLFVCSLIDFLCYYIHRCSSFTCMDVSMEMLRRTRNLLEKMENAKDRIHPVKYVHLKGASPNEIPSKFNSK